MIRILSICLTIFYASMSLIAQDEERTGLFSITAGYTLCTLNGSNFDVDFRSDFHIGIRKDVQLQSSTFLNTGILYCGLGSKLNREFSTDNLKIQTLQFPIGIKQYLSNAIYITGGGSINLRLGARVNRDAIPRETKFLDLAVSAGAGFNVNRFTLDIRWNYGLINIRKGDERVSGNNLYVLSGVAYRFSQ